MSLLAFAIFVLALGELAEKGRGKALEKVGSTLKEYYATKKWP